MEHDRQEDEDQERLWRLEAGDVSRHLIRQARQGPKSPNNVKGTHVWEELW